MKGLILVIIIFLICAVVGYQVAVHMDEPQNPGQGMEVKPTDSGMGEQHNLVIIHVDRLDVRQPRMISAWFVSLFFVKGAPPALTLAQMYPTRANAAIAQSFERSFSLTADGDPSPGFWKAVKALKIQWEGYLMVDDFTVQKVMEWTDGPGDYPALVSSTQDSPLESKQALMNTCQFFGDIASHGKAPFEWGDIAPAHFRSNLRMENALAYWASLTGALESINCQVLLAP